MAEPKKEKAKEEKPKEAAKEEKKPATEAKPEAEAPKKKKEKRGKKVPRKTKPSKKWAKYEVSEGKAKRKGKVCMKCGAGVFMGEHKNRWSCGKCHYTEFKKSEPKQ